MKFGTVDRHHGAWRARYIGPDGKRHSKSSRLWTKQDALGYLKKVQREIYLGAWEEQQEAATGYTVGEWLQYWLDLSAKRLKESTAKNYQETLNRRVFHVDGEAARFKDVPLEKVTRRDIASWFDAITKKYGWQPYNHAAYRRVYTALGEAVNHGLLPANPARDFKPAMKPAAKRKKLPTAEQLQAVVDNLPDHLQLLGVLCFFHGLRIGEALALQRRDISDTAISVHATVFRDKDSGVMVRGETPKTAAGVRDVPIFERFKPYFVVHLKKYVGRAKTAQLFVGSSGRIYRDNDFRARIITAKKRAGLDDLEISPHYGRVWLITELAAAGMPIPAIGEILGQKDLATITEIYMRAKPDHVQGILEQVNRTML